MLLLALPSILLAGSILLADPTFGMVDSPACLPLVRLLAGSNLPCTFSEEELSLQTLGTSATTYAWWNRPRSRNLELAVATLDGVVIGPHQKLSFNERIGSRTRARGFRKAKIITPKGYENGIGGGVCQAASMLHAASLYAGLTIKERSRHRYRVKYLPPGLDATVDFGSKDLVVENPYPFPVKVTARSDGQGHAFVRVSGPYVLQTTAYRYRIMESIPSDKVRFVQSPIENDPVEFIGRPAITVRKELKRTWLLSGEVIRMRLPKDSYEASPWQLRTTAVPSSSKPITGLSEHEINRYLVGSGFSVADGIFPDVKKTEGRWLPPAMLPQQQTVTSSKALSGGVIAGNAL